MDPLTQGLLGGLAGGLVARKKYALSGTLAGIAGGLFPDIDVFLPSFDDPVHSWIYHRHFTHSIILIPLMGILSVLPFLLLKRKNEWKRNLIVTGIAGAATHGFLDACTSYGTLLFWPFSNNRIAWDILPIIDPLVTIPLLAGIIFGMYTKSRKPFSITGAYFCLYILFGLVQEQRALHIAHSIARDKAGEYTNLRVCPAPLSLIVWRSIYISDDQIHSSTVRTPLFAQSTYVLHDASELFTMDTIPESKMNDDTFRAINVLTWFADGYVTPIQSDNEHLILGDARYSNSFSSTKPLWGLEINSDEEKPDSISKWSARPSGDEFLSDLSALISGSYPGLNVLSSD